MTAQNLQALTNDELDTRITVAAEGWGEGQLLDSLLGERSRRIEAARLETLLENRRFEQGWDGEAEANREERTGGPVKVALTSRQVFLVDLILDEIKGMARGELAELAGEAVVLRTRVTAHRLVWTEIVDRMDPELVADEMLRNSNAETDAQEALVRRAAASMTASLEGRVRRALAR